VAGGATLVVTDGRSTLDATVVICTRNRPQSLARVLDALERQTRTGFDVVVVDDSDVDDPSLRRLPNVRVLRGGSLSAAKNAGRRATRTRWMVCLDDDCVPDDDWIAALEREIERHPTVAMVWSRIDEGEAVVERSTDSVPHSLSTFTQQRIVSGRWVSPRQMGLGVAAIRIDWVDRIGGWDERLGPGAPEFAGVEDIDFNWRLLRAGGKALAATAPRVVHEQSRADEDLVSLYEIRNVAWAGMCVKYVKHGDVLGGAWLYFFGVKDAVRMSLSPLRRRSRLRLAYATAKWRGLARGTRLASQRSWS
jgi:GT2 family glycosyltransferase